MNPTIVAAINAALGLIASGTEIFTLIKGKESLSAEELQSIIDMQNQKQEEARAALLAALK